MASFLTEQPALWLGLVWVAIAIVTFGSFGVPIKSPKLVSAGVDSMVFQIYLSFAVLWSSGFVLFFAEWRFSYWAFVSAALWTPAMVLAIFAIKWAGLGVGQGVWSGTSILVSFLWGTLAFGESPESWPLTALGLALLLAGVAGLSLSSRPGAMDHERFFDAIDPFDRPVYKTSSAYLLEYGARGSSAVNTHDREVDEHLRTAFRTADDIDSASPLEVPSPRNMLRDSDLATKMKGIVAALCVGLLNGSMMAPFKQVEDELEFALEFVPSFSLGVACVTVVLAIGYFGAQRKMPKWHFSLAALRGQASGFMWQIGNVSSLYATWSPLGMTVGFPLTQCALLVSGLWGILYFEEIKDKMRKRQFAASAVLLVAGATLMGFYGSSSSDDD